MMQKTGGLHDPVSCTERDEVACFRLAADPSDSVCSPTMALCEMARGRFVGGDPTRISECFVVRYVP